MMKDNHKCINMIHAIRYIYCLRAPRQQTYITLMNWKQTLTSLCAVCLCVCVFVFEMHKSHFIELTKCIHLYYCFFFYILQAMENRRKMKIETVYEYDIHVWIYIYTRLIGLLTGFVCMFFCVAFRFVRGSHFRSLKRSLHSSSFNRNVSFLSFTVITFYKYTQFSCWNV